MGGERVKVEVEVEVAEGQNVPVIKEGVKPTKAEGGDIPTEVVGDNREEIIVALSELVEVSMLG